MLRTDILFTGIKAREIAMLIVYLILINLQQRFSGLYPAVVPHIKSPDIEIKKQCSQGTKKCPDCIGQ